MVPTTVKPSNSKVRRVDFTPLGVIYYRQSHLWQRLKIEAELLEELGVKPYTLRPYMVSTQGFRMRKDMQKIILRTLPEAEHCFTDTRIKTSKS